MSDMEDDNAYENNVPFITFGRDLATCGDIGRALEQHVDERGYNYIAVPLVHPRYTRGEGNEVGGFTKSDLLLPSHEWKRLIVGKVSPWIALDSQSDNLRIRSECALEQELAWAAHLCLPAVLLPTPRRSDGVANYARSLNAQLDAAYGSQIWIEFPLLDDEDDDDDDAYDSDIEDGDGFGPVFDAIAGIDDENEEQEEEEQEQEEEHTAVTGNGEDEEVTYARIIGASGDASATTPADAASAQRTCRRKPPSVWSTWNAIRSLVHHASHVAPVLELDEDVPSESILQKWLGEPVRAVIIPKRLYLSNKSGVAVLSPAHQRVVLAFVAHDVQILVRGGAYSEAVDAHRLPYLQHLIAVKSPPLSQALAFCKPYFDTLQAPLQPLMDHLQSSTYETFEKDGIKYAQYQEAIYHCLEERFRQGERVVLMVVGAGRGPLVRAALAAAKRAKRTLCVYAVEKNPNAVVTLEAMRRSLGWGDRVRIVSHDMRTWQAPELADVLVSELLGSWGDNEASPECLRGAQRFLKKETGISIPSSYTSYLAPLCSETLFNGVRSMGDEEKWLETPYVVFIHNAHILSESKRVFTFEHPESEKENAAATSEATPVATEATRYARSLSRYARLSFVSPCDTLVHGFSGTFEAVLYGHVTLSIRPETHTPQMTSWFPLFIPLRQPVNVRRGERIEAHVWRCANERRMWYEWSLTEPQATPIANANGEHYFIGL